MLAKCVSAGIGDPDPVGQSRRGSCQKGLALKTTTWPMPWHRFPGVQNYCVLEEPPVGLGLQKPPSLLDLAWVVTVRPMLPISF